MIAIIDYGAGNLNSVKNAFDFLGEESVIVSTPEAIDNANRIVLPGVGSFGFMMESLEKKKLIEPIKRAIARGVPFFGICLGLQILFEESEESKGVRGFGIFKGKVIKFQNGKVPQIGWNRITSKNEFFEPGYAYFVNSYYVLPEDKNVITTTTDYFGEFASSIQYKNITAVQFHPEKSGEFGIEIFRRWLKC